MRFIWTSTTKAPRKKCVVSGGLLMWLVSLFDYLWSLSWWFSHQANQVITSGAISSCRNSCHRLIGLTPFPHVKRVTNNFTIIPSSKHGCLLNLRTRSVNILYTFLVYWERNYLLSWSSSVKASGNFRNPSLVKKWPPVSWTINLASRSLAIAIPWR